MVHALVFMLFIVSHVWAVVSGNLSFGSSDCFYRDYGNRRSMYLVFVDINEIYYYKVEFPHS